jgi:fatty acid kinase fatty acid binding subunit
MGRGIAVVTDSTASLPAGVAEELGVRVVPLYVRLNGVPGVEGSDDEGGVSPADVARALSERRGTVQTSRARPEDFVAAFRWAFDRDAAGVVAVLVSGALSGTYESAMLAAQQCRGEPQARVVDSRSVAMGLGFAVIAAAEAARAGGALDEVYDAAVQTTARTTALFYVDTLEHLRRGGRIGTAQALLGTALSVKPILTVAEGSIVLKEKLRTSSRALARLEALAAEAAGERTVDIAVQHLGAENKAAALAARLTDRLPRLNRLYVSELGATIGAHVGPGVLGVVVARR